MKDSKGKLIRMMLRKEGEDFGEILSLDLH